MKPNLKKKQAHHSILVFKSYIIMRKSYLILITKIFLDGKEANFNSSEIPQFVTLKGKDFRFAKAKKASLEPLDQEYEREQNKNVIHTFRNENNPFRSVKINKHKEIVQMDINDENLDKILGSSNSFRYLYLHL